jgi:hypothetical protein
LKPKTQNYKLETRNRELGIFATIIEFFKTTHRSMTISYNWLHDYLPVTIDPERLSKLLTSVGLEVESLEKYESL